MENAIPKIEYQDCFKEWTNRCRICNSVGVEYIQGFKTNLNEKKRVNTIFWINLWNSIDLAFLILQYINYIYYNFII